jgi:hypothetical protein
MHDFELRLIGHPSEAGQVLAQDMVNLAGSTQALITRIARAVADRRGPGRSESALEQLSRVRVTGLSRGSTSIGFSFGDTAALEIQDPISTEIDETFWLIAAGLEQNHRPASINDSVAHTVDELIGALRHAAPNVEIMSNRHPPVRLRPAALTRQIWQSSTELGGETLSLIGILEALDLRNARFRIVDDVSNRIVLKDVRDPHDAAQLVDRRVRATGRPAYTPDRSLQHLADVDIVVVNMPPEWSRSQPDLPTVLKSAPGPSVDGGVDLTEQEFDDFMAAVHG